MQDKGINSTFKKIIYESSEMVFLADDTYPYSIFYGNESFEETIGENLSDRSLVGLGLDINAYIFKEELVLSLADREFTFKLELPQDSGSNYFLFYKGRELKTVGLPSKKESYQFFNSSLEILAVGKGDQLTYVNPICSSILGYNPEELLFTNLCPFIFEGDLSQLQGLWKSHKTSKQVLSSVVRFQSKNNGIKYLDLSVQFQEESFFVIAKDVTHSSLKIEAEKVLLNLKRASDSSEKVGWFKYFPESNELELEFSWTWLLGKQPEDNSQLSPSFIDQIKGTTSVSPAGSEFLTPDHDVIYVQAFKTFQDEIWGVLTYKQEDKVLKSSLEFQQAIWENSPESMVVIRPDASIVAFSLEFCSLFGFSKSEDLVHLQDLNSFFGKDFFWKDWIKDLTPKDKIRKTVSEVSNESAEALVLEVSSRSFEFLNQKYFELSFKNISEKISLEKTIENSNQFLLNLTEQVPGGLYQLVLNSEGQMKFSFLSKGIQSVLGITSEQINELTDLSAAISRVHPADLPKVIMTSVASAKKMEPWQCQFRVKSDTQGQHYRWILGAARPQSLGNGDMVWYGYLTDITHQKEFESNLNEAKEAAEKANQIKSDFLSMISHELRTPLNAISGSVYSLIQENPNEGQKSALNTINFAVDNLIIMINDLLDFQKIEAGKLTIEHNPFHLGDLMNQVISGLSFHAKDSKNKLTLHASPELGVMVKGDKTRMSQVLNNLITNALKFTKAGNVDVKAELLSREVDKIRVYFEVKDTGIGIAPEHQEKIFNDFDQVKPTFSTKYGGTGLGLSITRKLLNLMGGKIAVESEVGVGSRFFFELEFDLALDAELPVSTQITQIAPKTDLHLLMAEDNDVNALVLGKIIKKWGYTFERVNNGLEAVNAVRENSYDCILMDIQMPEMDGFEATTEIKKFSSIPVIALTAAAKLEIMERIEECGFDGFVAKPIDAAELLKKIREVISEKIS